MTRANTTCQQVQILGCGDIGQRVGVRWQARNIPVLGVVRSDTSQKHLQAAGIAAVTCDLGQTACCLPELASQTLIYYFVPPPSTGVHDLHCKQFLACLGQQPLTPARIVAISTTGVYGDHAGAVVSEDTPPNPQVDRGRRRYDMECQLRDWCERNQCDLIILRVGGIYGPGRLPLERIKKGIPILYEDLAPRTNRIHAEDLADICVAAAQVEQHYRVYNVSDGTDSNMSEYFLTLADFFHLPRPPQVDWAEAERVMSAGMLSYLRESRRISNARMLKELRIQLQYPDLKTGLESCK
ncbi:MAG: SDR family oxidoreductase [Gammaproteobacteria bacterium]